MKTTCLGALAALGLGMPAAAFEALTFGDLSFAPGLGVNLTTDREGAASYAYLDGTLTWTHQLGSLTFGAEAYASLEQDSSVEGAKVYLLDDPIVDLGVWVEGETFGRLSYGQDSSAIGQTCIEAPSAGDNFTHGDAVSVGTCPSYDTRAALFYESPDLGQGVKLAVSYMPRTGFETVEAGEAAESVSVALSVDHQAADGATWTGSLGTEKVISVEGGGRGAQATQAGLSWTKEGWTLGGALNLTENGDGSRDRSAGLAVQREVTEALKVSFGANAAQSRADGAALDESSVSALAIWTVVPDKVMADAGIWRLRSEDAGSVTAETQVSLGLSLYF